MKYVEVVLSIVAFMKNNSIEEQFPMPVNNMLIEEVGKYLQYSNSKYIRVVPIDTSNKLILGKLRHFEKGVDIAVNDTLNTCWKRFVITKELSHLIMSKNSEGITLDMEKLVDGLFKHSFGISDDIDHEKLAVYMACEYLMPYKISQPILENNQKSDLYIAEKFSVPEVMIKIYRDMDFLDMRRDSYETALEEHKIIK